jgi:tripartite-type tricarboxylate transporter receptor subunit TctC
MKLPHRRQFLHLATSAVAFSVILHPAHAQIYPARPVTLIVPSAAAGPTDVAARIVGEHMSRTLGQRLVVENVVGAGGTTGSLRAMRARPDGYTIEMGHTGTHAVAVSFYPNLGYKPDTDFEPIGVVVYLPHVIITRKEFPAADIKEFVSYVQANSEKLNLAHTGVGSMTFTNALLLNAALGTKPTLVPFGSNAPAMTALLGGQVDYFLGTILDIAPQLDAASVKVLALGAKKRHPLIPNVPTTVEAGIPNLDVPDWFALFAPRGTAFSIIGKLSDALDKALDDDNTRKRLFELGGEIPDKETRGPQALARMVRRDIDRWAPIIKAANVRAE